MNYQERLENMRGRIGYRGEARGIADCILIDDVFTTGATLSECARILKERGARQVDCLSLALDL